MKEFWNAALLNSSPVCASGPTTSPCVLCLQWMSEVICAPIRPSSTSVTNSPARWCSLVAFCVKCKSVTQRQHNMPVVASETKTRRVKTHSTEGSKSFYPDVSRRNVTRQQPLAFPLRLTWGDKGPSIKLKCRRILKGDLDRGIGWHFFLHSRQVVHLIVT